MAFDETLDSISYIALSFISWSVWFVVGGMKCPQQCMSDHHFGLRW